MWFPSELAEGKWLKDENTYFIEKLLQFILQLQKVLEADQTLLDCVATVFGQLNQLEVNKFQGKGGLEQVPVWVLCI